MRNEQTILPGLMNARAAFQNFVDEFLYMKKHNGWGVLTYTFHQHVIACGHRMLALEAFIEVLASEGPTSSPWKGGRVLPRSPFRTASASVADARRPFIATARKRSPSPKSSSPVL